jgi:hypothetical protein
MTMLRLPFASKVYVVAPAEALVAPGRPSPDQAARSAVRPHTIAATSTTISSSRRGKRGYRCREQSDTDRTSTGPSVSENEHQAAGQEDDKESDRCTSVHFVWSADAGTTEATVRHSILRAMRRSGTATFEGSLPIVLRGLTSWLHQYPP